MGNLANRIQRQTFELASALATHHKANKLTDALLQFVGNGQLLHNDADHREQVQRGYMFNPDVYSIVGLITNAASTVKWCLYEVTDVQKARRYSRLPAEAKQHRFETVYRLKQQAYTEVEDESNTLYKLLHRPNEMEGWTEFVQKVLGFKLVTGNAFVHGVVLENGTNAGQVSELWAMPSQYMAIEADRGAETVVSSYVLEYLSSKARFTPDEVLHLKYWNPDYESNGSHLYGMSPLRAAARVVRQSNDAYTAQASLLQNSGAMGILSVDPDNMSQEQGEELEKSYYAKYGGPAKRGRIVITASKIDWKQIGMSSVDLNILESQKYSLRDLCNVYQVNSALLNDPENKTYNNMQEARKALYMEKVLPELDALRDELNRWLVERHNRVTGKRYYLDYDLESIPALQTDVKLVMEQVRDAWWLTGNERREAMGYDTAPEMETFFVPSSLVPTAQLSDAAPDEKAYAVKRTFTNYPQAATNAAKRAIEYTADNPNDCATAVGKQRAQQLAKREPLSLETVKRTYSFLSRAKAYDTGKFEDSDGKPVCGSISYAYWGGDSMLTWSRRVVEQHA